MNIFLFLVLAFILNTIFWRLRRDGMNTAMRRKDARKKRND